QRPQRVLRGVGELGPERGDGSRWREDVVDVPDSGDSRFGYRVHLAEPRVELGSADVARAAGPLGDLGQHLAPALRRERGDLGPEPEADRKSTRLNSSHVKIS